MPFVLPNAPGRTGTSNTPRNVAYDGKAMVKQQGGTFSGRHGLFQQIGVRPSSRQGSEQATVQACVTKVLGMIRAGQLPAPEANFKLTGAAYDPRFFNGPKGDVMAVEHVPEDGTPNSGKIIVFAPGAETMEKAVLCLAHELWRFNKAEGADGNKAFAYAQGAQRIYNGGTYIGPTPVYETEAEGDVPDPHARPEHEVTPGGTPNARPKQDVLPGSIPNARPERPVTPGGTPHPRPEHEVMPGGTPNPRPSTNAEATVEHFDLFMQAIAANNATAYDKLVTSGAMAAAQAEAAKRKEGAALKEIAEEWKGKVKVGNATYQEAIETITKELKKELADARSHGVAMRNPVNRARNRIAIEAGTRHPIGNPQPKNPQPVSKAKAVAIFNDAAKEAKVLTKAGNYGKAVYTGLLLVQLGFAATEDAQANEFEKGLPDHLSQVVLGLAIGVGLTAAFAALAPVGALGVLAAGVAFGIVGDEAAAGIVAVLDEEFKDVEFF